MTTTRGVAGDIGLATAKSVRWAGRVLRGHVVQAVGGPARARVITLFACVLALNSADTSTIGAVAPQLEHALHIGNARIGLLSSATLLVGGDLRDSLRDAGRPGQACADSLGEHRPLERRLAGQRIRRQLLGVVAHPPVDGRGDGNRRSGDRLPDGGLLPVTRAGDGSTPTFSAGRSPGRQSASPSAGTIAGLHLVEGRVVLLALPGFWLARGPCGGRCPSHAAAARVGSPAGVTDLHAALAAANDDAAWAWEHGAESDQPAGRILPTTP